MSNLLKAEFECGALTKKILLAILWLFFAALTIRQILIVINDQKVRGRIDYDHRNQLTGLIVVVLVLLVVLILSFRRFSCVPYWNNKFSNAQLVKLLQDEEFVPLEGKKELKFYKIEVSENWVKMNGFLFSRHLTAYIKGSMAVAYVPDPKVLDVTMIDGKQISVQSGYCFWGGDEKAILHAAGMKYIGDYDPKFRQSNEFQKIFSTAFESVWQGRSYKELPGENLKRVRALWDAETKKLLH